MLQAHRADRQISSSWATRISSARPCRIAQLPHRQAAAVHVGRGFQQSEVLIGELTFAVSPENFR